MSRRKKTFYDCYNQIWKILDSRKKLNFWNRMRMKQIVNQMLHLYFKDIK